MAKKGESKYQATHVSVDGRALRLALQSVVPAVSTDKDRPSLNGVCLEAAAVDNTLIVTSSNVATVARYECQGLNVEAGFRLLVPLHVVKLFFRLFGKGDKGTVSIVCDEKLARIRVDGETNQTIGTLDVHLGDGLTFPDLDPMWPRGDVREINHIAFTPDQQIVVAKAFKAALDGGVGMRYELRGSEAPVIVTSESTPQLRILVMPAHDSDAGSKKAESAQTAFFGDVEAEDDEEPSVGDVVEG